MLENLSKVNWSELEIASGSAETVPNMIKDLTDDDPDVIQDALIALSMNIWEHGIIFDATIAAIPFLIELLDADATDDPAGVLDLLAQIAESRDLEEVMLPPAHEYQFMPEEGEVYTKDEQEMQWSRDAYDAVGKGLPVYRQLLNDADPLVRTSAAALLQQFPIGAKDSAAALRDAIDQEDDIPTMTDMMMSLRDLLTSAVMVDEERKTYQDFYASIFEDETDPALRLGAAVAIAQLNAQALSQDMIDLITDAVITPATYAEYVEDTLENPVHEALPVLLQLEPEQRTEPMLKAMRQTGDVANARSLAVATLVDAFGEEPLEGRVAQRQVQPGGVAVIYAAPPGMNDIVPLRTSLTDKQRAAVETILENDAFWVVVSNLLTVYGLPQQRHDLLNYLDDPEAFANR